MRRTGWWLLFVVLVLLVAFDVLVLITAVVDTAQGHEKGGVGPAIGAVVIFVIIGAALLVAAAASEHHVRRNHHAVGGRFGVPAAKRAPRVTSAPGAKTATGAPSWDYRSSAGAATSSGVSSGPEAAPGAAPGAEAVGGAVVPDWNPSPVPTTRSFRPRRTTSRRHHPFATIILFLGLSALAIGLPTGTGVSFSDWRTSVSIQDHGIRSTLTVVEVIQVNHSSRSGSYDTVNLVGTLSPTVQGYAETTVHTPHDDTFYESQQVAVLVNPSDPSQAELPGQPANSVGGFIALLVITVIFYAFFIWGLVGYLRTHRRRRLQVRT